MILAASTAGHVLEKVGVVVAAILAAGVVLGAGRAGWERRRAGAELAVLVLTPVLLLANIWHSPQLRPLRHHPALGIGAALAAAAAVAGLAFLLRRRREALPLLAVAALPFRIPIASGGTTSNLLVPLYLVIAGAALAEIVPALAGRGAAKPDSRAGGPPGRLEWLLMGSVVLYAVQASYSSDFSKALEQIVFFYVPFALLFAALRQVAWTRQLLVSSLAVAVALAVIFVAIGFVEYSRRELLLNPRVVASNQVQSYFRVNSLFFDPNIYGRFLAMVMIALAGALLWFRGASAAGERRVLAIGALLAFLWGGLLVSFSQSSMAALLVGLAALAAVRWSARWAVLASIAVFLAGLVVVLAAPRVVRFDVATSQGANRATSGRYHLIERGLELFADRPVQGYGSASFVKEYRARKHSTNENAASASHTIPVTVAAEQGVVGLAVYLALLVAAFARLYAGPRSPPRVIIAAAFTALVFHTLLYADFLEDPVTWTLLGIGTALAWQRGRSASAAAESAPARTPVVAA